MNQKSLTNCLLARKEIGQTPLECINSLKARGIIDPDMLCSYAGRLDPMASGLLLILLHEETKRRDIYERLPKKYDFEVLFGVETDTYDVLGLITEVKTDVAKLSIQDVDRAAQELSGTFVQPYPPYSSALVDGKPLWEWSRKGELDQHTVPTKEVTIFSIGVDGEKTMNSMELKALVSSQVHAVTGDFRQEEIIAGWNTQLSDDNVFNVFTMHAIVSSGTYIRSIAHTLGKKLRTPSLAFSITRSKIGNIELERGEEYRFVTAGELDV